MIDKKYNSKEYEYIISKLNILNSYIKDLQKREKEAKISEKNVFDKLIIFYSKKRDALNEPLSQYYSILNSKYKERIPFLIKNWEREFNELKRQNIFNFNSIDVEKMKIKKIK